MVELNNKVKIKSSEEKCYLDASEGKRVKYGRLDDITRDKKIIGGICR